MNDLISMAPIKKDQPVTDIQRQLLERYIDTGLCYGKKEGINYMTKEEAGKVIHQIVSEVKR